MWHAGYQFPHARVVFTGTASLPGWCLPDWEGEHHYDLEKPAYSDFIAFARQKGLLMALFNLKKSRQVYEVLGGNFRAFEFFVKAANGMDLAQAEQFLAALNNAKDESQTDMALEHVLSQRSTLEKALLTRLLAYSTAVPIKGVTIIARKVLPPLLKLDEHVEALEALAHVSLVERIPNREFDETDYQLAPLVRDYLNQQGQTVPIETLKVAALYLNDELLKDREQLDLALLVHKALLDADEPKAAQQLLLNNITVVLNLAGLYHTLLDDYLIPSFSQIHSPKIHAVTQGQIGKQYLHVGSYDLALNYLKQSLAITQEIGDKSGEGNTLNNLSSIYQALGDFDTALNYLNKSLAIHKEIGDKSGLCVTLFNLGHIHKQNKEIEKAMSVWIHVYRLAKDMEEAQALALAALSQLKRGRVDLMRKSTFNHYVRV